MLGYRSISPNKPLYPGYDVTDSVGSYESPMYKDPKHFGGRPDVRDGAEADAVKSRLNFSGGDSGEGREMANYHARDEQKDFASTSNESPYLSAVPSPYDPMQYQDKVCLSFICLWDI